MTVCSGVLSMSALVRLKTIAALRHPRARSKVENIQVRPASSRASAGTVPSGSAGIGIATDQLHHESEMASRFIRDEVRVALVLWVAGLIPLAIVCLLIAG